MTTTVALSNVPSSSPTDVAIYLINHALLRQTRQESSKNGVTTTYTYAGGDSNKKLTVVVSTEVNTANNTLRTSISMKTTQTVTVDSVITEEAPIIVTMSWVTPGPTEDTAKLLAMLGTLYGLAFNGVTSKVPNVGLMDVLNLGVTDRLYGS